MTIIKVRRHTAAIWTSTNPVLADGEPGLETDTRKLKFGNGATAWTSLGYVNAVTTAAVTGLPAGGTANQVLTKISSADGDAGWNTPVVSVGDGGTVINNTISPLPIGGVIHQVLTKRTNSDGDVDWENAPSATAVLPTGGATNQVLTKLSNADSNAGWVTPVVPTGAAISFTPDSLTQSTNVEAAIKEVRAEAASGVATAASKAGIPALGCLWGATVGAHPGTQNSASYIANTATLEAKFGSSVPQFPAHRLYVPPQNGFLPNTRANEMADDASKGRTTVISLKCPTNPATGSSFTWAQMAANPIIQGRSIGCLTEAAQQLGAYTHPIVIIADHECDNPSAQRGTPTEYGQWMTAFFTQIRQYAPKVSTAVNMAGYRFYSGAMSAATLRQYLPVDLSLMDILASDPYNYRSTSGMGADTYPALVTPWLNYAASINKPYGSFEMGCTLAVGETIRQQWWSGALAFIQQNTRIKLALAWSDTTGTNNNDFFIDDTTALLNVIKSATSAPYFHPTSGGAGGSVSAVSVDGGSTLLTGNIIIPVNGPSDVASLRDGLVVTHTVVPTSNVYTAVPGDANCCVEVNSSATCYVLLPSMTAGSQIEFMQLTDYAFVFGGTGGTTIKSLNNKVTSGGKYSSVFARARSTTDWHLSGALT